MQLPDGISVILCCYNSSERLGPTLSHLAKQALPNNLSWEIVLVNNASTDNTVKLASQQWQDMGAPAPLRIIEELRPGTDHARRTGIYAASYAYFVFCDDDNWLAGDYLALTHDYLKTHPMVGAVGGVAEAVSDKALPDWFDDVAGYYAVGAPADKSGDISGYGLWGAGMGGRTANFRIALPEEIPLLNAGRIGHSTGMGEDGEMCKRIVLQGLQVHFYEQLRLQHFIDPRKLTRDHAKKLVADCKVPAEIIASYARAARLQQFNGLKKTGFLLWHAIKHRLQPDNKFSRDFLFYGWNKNQTANSQNIQIRNYIYYLMTNKKQFKQTH